MVHNVVAQRRPNRYRAWKVYHKCPQLPLSRHPLTLFVMQRLLSHIMRISEVPRVICIFEVVVTNPPIGLGTYAQWDRRLSARLAMAAMSIQAMKGVEIGMGFESARRFGSEVHDDIFFDETAGQFVRKSNNAGGLEGGITNGQPIIVRVAMKPIATLYTPKDSVDIATKEPFKATVERSDICTVPAAGVVGEAVIAYEMANALIEKFGGDSMEEMKRNYEMYQEHVRSF